MSDPRPRRRTRPLEPAKAEATAAGANGAPPSPEPNANVAPPSSEPSAELAPVVLVVDDEADIREWLRISLSLEGWTVVEASNGKEALAHWRRAEPDVVLLDQRLGAMSGFDCAARLRELSEDTRIIMVSGYLDAEATKEARRLRILPIEKSDHKRLFELLALLAEQVRTARKSSVA